MSRVRPAWLKAFHSRMQALIAGLRGAIGPGRMIGCVSGAVTGAGATVFLSGIAGSGWMAGLLCPMPGGRGGGNGGVWPLCACSGWLAPNIIWKQMPVAAQIKALRTAASPAPVVRLDEFPLMGPIRLRMVSDVSLIASPVNREHVYSGRSRRRCPSCRVGLRCVVAGGILRREH